MSSQQPGSPPAAALIPPLTAAVLPSPPRQTGAASALPAPRRRRGVSGYSRFVRLSRVMLPLAAVGLLVTVVAWPHLRDLVEPVRVVQGSGAAAGDAQMMGPRYFGVDNLNRPYSVTGRSGIPNAVNGEVFSIADPEAEITLENGSWVTVRAAQGEVDRQRRTVRLRGNVNVFRDDGYTFTTEEAFVDLNQRLTWGDRPIEGHGPQIEIEAQGFRIVGQGSTVVFTGPTRVVLRPAEGDRGGQSRSHAPDQDAGGEQGGSESGAQGQAEQGQAEVPAGGSQAGQGQGAPGGQEPGGAPGRGEGGGAP